jgi:predicted amidohydrolase
MRAAAVQLNSGDDVDRNLEAADRLTRAAARDGAELVVLPEKWPALGPPEVVSGGARRADDVLDWARRAATELGIDLVAGSIAVPQPAVGKLANTAFHFAPDGRRSRPYVKLHLFDVEVEGREYRESDGEVRGDGPVTSTLADGTSLGLAICYDLRFGALFDALQTQVVALPSAFTLATTRVHWDVLVRARAIEHQAFLVAANQAGEHPGGMRSGGRSMLVDPWGTVLAQAPEDGETYVVADLDLDEQRRVRTEMPVLDHRRASLEAGLGTVGARS